MPQKAFRRQGLRSGSGDLEPFRILRTAVDFARVTRPVRTVMVTSAVRGEGKTSVAIGLAQAIALSGRPVILVELDLRHPSLARTFGMADQGVTNALLGSDPTTCSSARSVSCPTSRCSRPACCRPTPPSCSRRRRST